MNPNALRRVYPVVLMTVLFCFLFATGCSDDKSVTTPDGADVNAYLESLPSWNELSPKLADSDVTGDATADIDWNQQLICTITPCSITRTPEDIVTYSPNSEILYLGSLIQGKTYISGLGAMQELPIRQRSPLTLSIDLHTTNSSRVVQNPSLSTVMDAIHDLVAEAGASGYKAGSSIFFSQTTNHSLEQSALALGMSAKYMGASVKASLRAETTKETNSLTAYFIQKMFTTSVELPQTPGAFFSNEFTKEQLESQVTMGRIGPDNLPVFVSNIVWGRMMTLTMTSTAEISAMKAALSASYAGIGGTVGAEHLQVLNNSTIKLVTVGGDANAALGYLRTGQLGSFFAEDAPLTTAVPLSYTVRNLCDNSVAMVSETTDFDLVECSPLVATLLPNEPTWRASVLDAGMDILEFPFTSTNMAKADQIAGPPGGNAWIADPLTFAASNTGFPFNFTIDATSSPSVTWNDDEMGCGNCISIGDADNYEDDDFEIVVTDTLVYAMSIYIGDNGFTAEEYLQVWATSGYSEERFLHQFPYNEMQPFGGFIGVVSPVPIRRIHFNEDAGGDDITIANLLFATQ